MGEKTNTDIKTFTHTIFDDYIGKKIHLYLKNRFHYLCKINRIREFNGDLFIEILDFKKQTTQLISSNDISRVEVIL